MMPKTEQRASEWPRATPSSSRWNPQSHCGDARAQLIATEQDCGICRGALGGGGGGGEACIGDGVSAEATMLRSGRMKERKKQA